MRKELPISNYIIANATAPFPKFSKNIDIHYFSYGDNK